MKYKCVSSHLENIDDGRTLEPGQVIELDSSDAKMPEAERLINEGLLIEAEKKKKGGSA